ncbi:MAG: SpoIID/LytB domain-containing protein [Drouetiella hepatica Uher 2000/2452]|jgi:peptidoglycan hydrolase-like amidase|uniref:SpoIID/LytB domain-containing protein n=1 Tax=Drouetiella hepatica Uher 2000/2452 TaxID=904376 RepID=A0A951UP99_9CYAN|nr:SpoIID/LytB domain-containing protein [Drouetiella hepatica Uher 2000/2452]
MSLAGSPTNSSTNGSPVRIWLQSGLQLSSFAAVLGAICWVGLVTQPGVAQEAVVQGETAQETVAQGATQVAPLNPRLDVGVVQRFGSDSKDEIILKPEPGDSLTLTFKQGEQPQTLTTNGDVKVDVVMQPIPQPRVSERVVLSTHRSFESAEDSADRWKQRGIEVELAQPKQWQVWAKRNTYSSALLRRLLMQNLQSHGSRTAFIDTQIQRQEPKAMVTVNGNRYQEDEIAIATNQPVNVTFNRGEHGTKAYAGSLKLQTNAYGTYTLVNQVPLETYLRGVVPHEIGPGAPTAAIEAQAILARTYVLRNLRRFAIDNYQLCADTQCQVYRGLTGADGVADRAIANTRGQVLTYQNELVDALYSSTTGGVTARFSDVWNGSDRPYLQSVVDSVQNIWDLSSRSLADEQNFRAFIAQKAGFNEVGWDMFRWRVVSPLPDLAKDLRSYLQSKQNPLANFTQVQDIKVLERSPTGRVQKLAITTDRGIVELEKDEILRALYAPNSTLFYVEPVYEQPTAKVTPQPPAAVAQGSNAAAKAIEPMPKPFAAAVLKGFVFTGGGLGHGVGMSQTGSYHLGELGWSGSQILSFYYPGTQLQPLTNAIVFWQPVAQSQTSVPVMKAIAPKKSNFVKTVSPFGQ